MSAPGGGLRQPPRVPRGRRRGALAGLAALALAVPALAGCGAASPDLFLLTRAGSGPGTHLTLLVNDGGTVRCNGGAPRPLTDPQLLAARDVTSSIEKDAQKDLKLPAPSGSLLRFHIRAQAGTVTFSDLDAAHHPELAKAIAFTQEIAHNVCHVAR